MSVTRTTLGNLRAKIAKVRASLPPRVWFVEPREDEGREAFDARMAKAQREAAAWEAKGRGAAVIIIIDRAEDEA